MAQKLYAGSLERGGPELPGPSTRATARAGPRVDGIHFVPNDGRRFPFCGSWRSNWNQTGDAERATCPDCRARLAAPPPLPPGSAGEK